MMGKSETFRREGESSWHGHVTCLTVTPEHRRLGLANKLMNLLEEVRTSLLHFLKRFADFERKDYR